MRGFAFIVFGLAASLIGAQHQAEVLELLRSSDWEKAQMRFLLARDILIPDVILALKHEDAKVRARAAEALRVVDSEGPARQDLKQGLGKHRKAATDALLIAAKDPIAEVKDDAIWALAYLLRNREFGHHGDPSSSPKKVEPIIKLGKGTTPALTRLLAHEAEKDDALHGAKLAALRVLRATKDPRALEPLIKLVKQAEGFLLYEGMLALAEHDDPRVAKTVVDAIDREISGYGPTPSMWVIQQELKTRAIPELIWAVVNHSRASVREHCATMLTSLPDKRSIKALQKATEDKAAAVRRKAAWALGRNIDPSNVPVLRKLLNDPDERVREAAAESLTYQPKL